MYVNRSLFRFSTLLMKSLSLFIVFIGCQQTNESSHDPIIWFKEAATVWEEALPLGNGRLGAMVFGNPTKERIQLNDDSLWPGEMEWGNPAGTPEDLEEIRQLIIQGNIIMADSLMIKKFSRKTVVRSHQTLGDLFIELDHDSITDYRRSLNLNDALAQVDYKTQGYSVQEKVFVSQPHQVIVVTLKSEHPEGLNGSISLSRPADEGIPTVEVFKDSNDHLVMEGEITQRKGSFDSQPHPINQGVQFQTLIKASHQKGSVKTKDDRIELSKVRELVLYIVSNSSYYHNSYKEKNLSQLQALESSTLNRIETEHQKDHQSFFKRVHFDLITDNDLDSIPTNKRLKAVKEGQTDLELQETLFHFGRYLLIASSRPGTLPANLQGLWNQHIQAPWNADYHLNINLQMNYWLANATQLDELNEPLFDFVDRLIENGKSTARENFGARGSFLPHATDLWAPTWLRAPTAYWGASFGAGGWMAQHYWNHYEFTQDLTFLKERAFPAIQSVAQFYSDWLIEDPRDGTLISVPSTSPENRYLNSEGQAVSNCLGSAMDQQVIHEVFTNYLKSAKLLNIQNEWVDVIEEQLKKLRPGFVVGPQGRILEWDREYPELEPGHRHMSQLYGFHPGNQVSKESTPFLFDAVRKTLDYRLANGGAGTGWSRAWLINCAARLMDGKMAQKHIQLLLEKSIYTNLFDAHPPFQIDGNFGYTAGVAEILVQSHENDLLRLLPALPPLWKNGKVKGLKARGNILVDMEWQNNQLTEAVLIAAKNTKTKLVYNGLTHEVNLKKGVPFEFNPN